MLKSWNPKHPPKQFLLTIVEPQWGSWGSWASCVEGNKECKQGMRTKQRECVGGSVGQGSCTPPTDSTQTEECTENMCMKGKK